MGHDADQPAALQLTVASSPKPGRPANEDLIGTLGETVWLLDGATYPEGLPRCCDRGARWYVQRLSAALADTLTATGDRIDLREVLAAAIGAVTHEHRSACPGAGKRRSATGSAPQGPSSTVVIVRRHQAALDYLVLGDSSLLVETDQGVTHHSDQRLAKVANAIREEILARGEAGHGYQDPEHRRLVRALVAAQQAVRNTPAGYWIAADDPVAAHHSSTGTHPLDGSAGSARRFALLSDGLERAVTTFGLYPHWRALLTGLCEDGPAACIRAVRAAEAADPQGQAFPRTSPSDDASAAVGEFKDQ